MPLTPLDHRFCGSVGACRGPPDFSLGCSYFLHLWEYFSNGTETNYMLVFFSQQGSFERQGRAHVCYSSTVQGDCSDSPTRLPSSEVEAWAQRTETHQGEEKAVQTLERAH